jgi:hypothetical protein
VDGGGGHTAHEVSARLQGLTLVHFSAQPEPFLTQNASQTPPSAHLHPEKQPPNNPKCTPVPLKALTFSRKVDEYKPLPDSLSARLYDYLPDCLTAREPECQSLRFEKRTNVHLFHICMNLASYG